MPRKKQSTRGSAKKSSSKRKTSTRSTAKKTSSRKKSSPNIGRRNKSPPNPTTIVIQQPKPPRRNAAPEPVEEASTERTPIKERVQEMDGSHVAVGVGAGALGNMLGVLVVGKGWVGPKTTAGLLVGTGALTATAGYVWESDHLMAAGAGLATAGTFSLTNQYAIDAYESLEERAKKKEAERDRKELEKRVAEARVVVQADKKQAARNAGPRLVIVEPDDDFEDVNGVDGVDDDDVDDDDYRQDLAA